MEDLLFRAESYRIRGAVFEVYREMGCGFLESVYQECLDREFRARGIPAVAQQELGLLYKGEPLAQTYRPDFVCFDIPDAFVVGYGLDYNDLYRNLPYVAVLEPHELAEEPNG